MLSGKAGRPESLARFRVSMKPFWDSMVTSIRVLGSLQSSVFGACMISCVNYDPQLISGSVHYNGGGHQSPSGPPNRIMMVHCAMESVSMRTSVVPVIKEKESHNLHMEDAQF